MFKNSQIFNKIIFIEDMLGTEVMYRLDLIWAGELYFELNLN